MRVTAKLQPVLASTVINRLISTFSSGLNSLQAAVLNLSCLMTTMHLYANYGKYFSSLLFGNITHCTLTLDHHLSSLNGYFDA